MNTPNFLVLGFLCVCFVWTTIECLTPRPIKVQGLRINSLAPAFFLACAILFAVFARW